MFFDTIAAINKVVNDFVWGVPAMVCIIGVGLLLSVRTGFLQIRKFPFALKTTIGRMFHKKEAADGAMTPFQAVCTALAGTVGTGNIAGVAGAIAIGGPGAVFWMWCSALLGMCTKYAEVTLAVHYRERSATGEWIGGPMYYIKNGLGKRCQWLAILDALLKTIYTPGAWNDNRPFSYDLDDPLGREPANKRLDIYLRTRKGNCVSMPILFAILAQRLGLPVALATAPSHVMVKFADDTQQAWVNIEATQGSFKFDSSYERDTHVSPLALQNDIYLRPLLPREGVGVIASTLMEHYARQKNADALLEVAELALAANPKDTVALIWKGNAYYIQLQDRYTKRYPNPADIPADKVVDYQRLSQGNLAMFDQAERLGWAPWTPDQEAAYLQSIEREKTRRGQ